MENQLVAETSAVTLNTNQDLPIHEEDPKNFWEEAVERVKASKIFYGYYLATIVILSQLPTNILFGLYDLFINSNEPLFSLEIFYLSFGLVSFFTVLILLNRVVYKILFFIVSFIILVIAFLNTIEGKDTSGLMGIYVVPFFYLGILIAVLTLEYFRMNKYIVYLVKLLFIIAVFSVLSLYIFEAIKYQNEIKEQEKRSDLKTLSKEKFTEGDYITPADMISLCKTSAMYKDFECHLKAALKYDDIHLCTGSFNFNCLKQYLATKEESQYQNYCDLIPDNPTNDTMRASCYSLVKPNAKFDISTFCNNDNNDRFAFCHSNLGKITGDWIFCEDIRLTKEKRKSCYGLMTQVFNYTISEDNKPRKNIPSFCMISVVNNRENINCVDVSK